MAVGELGDATNLEETMDRRTHRRKLLSKKNTEQAHLGFST